jgi:hypothetical protein
LHWHSTPTDALKVWANRGPQLSKDGQHQYGWQWLYELKNNDVVFVISKLKVLASLHLIIDEFVDTDGSTHDLGDGHLVPLCELI